MRYSLSGLPQFARDWIKPEKTFEKATYHYQSDLSTLVTITNQHVSNQCAAYSF